jgi:hypothetical protein
MLNITKEYVGVYAWIHIFLTSALAGGEWSASRPCRFTPGRKIPRYPLDRTAGLDDVEKKKFLTTPGLEPDPSVVQPVGSRYTDCVIPALS